MPLGDCIFLSLFVSLGHQLSSASSLSPVQLLKSCWKILRVGGGGLFGWPAPSSVSQGPQPISWAQMCSEGRDAEKPGEVQMGL